MNSAYSNTFVFDNDFAALRPAAAAGEFNGGPLLQARGEPGGCRVICYSPRHSDTLGGMSIAAIRRVVDTWAEQTAELGALPLINAVTIFENRGAMMGASSPHPHGQIWANATIPNELGKESAAQLAYAEAHGGCLLCDYVTEEVWRAERLVTTNPGFVALVPFWATWPFETLVLPRRHLGAIEALDAATREQFAAILKDLATRYDALFGVPFPYSMGLHQRPTDGASHAYWHLHAHFYPPLLRSATVRKFMVGYELLAAPQRDITPEMAAQMLRKSDPQSASHAGSNESGQWSVL